MTATVLPRLRTLAETRTERPALVDLAAHDLAHRQPLWGCPWCPQSGVCPLCALPSPECADPAGHRRVAAEGESAWREVA